MNLLIIVVLAALFFVSVLLGNVSRVVHVAELKRRARDKSDKRAGAIYKLMVYGGSLDLLLWIVGSLSAAGLLVLAADASPWLVVAAALVFGWLVWRSPPSVLPDWQWSLAAAVAPAATSLLSVLQPILGRVADFLEQRRLLPPHSRIYEKEDLLELLNSQNHQMDNRVPENELKMAQGALTFGDKSVGSVMTPRRMVKTVVATDAVGPLLMDELHGSGFSRFPVIKDSTKASSSEIVGMLYLHDLVGHGESGRVRDLMKKKVYFINEAQTLRDALGAFLNTDNHLLVVVNNFEEIVGIITIEDVIEQILGEKITDEFDQYEDLRAVAGLEAKKEENKHSSAKVVE